MNAPIDRGLKLMWEKSLSYLYFAVEMNAPIDRGLKHGGDGRRHYCLWHVEMNAPIDRGLKHYTSWEIKYRQEKLNDVKCS